MAESKEEIKNSGGSGIGSVLLTFFAIVALGGIFLSLGLIGAIKWMNQKPSAITPGFAAAGIIIGSVLDAWAVWFFLKRRRKIYEQLK